MSRRINVRCGATAYVTEEWLIEVPDDFAVTDDAEFADVLSFPEQFGVTIVSVENSSVDDEHDREVLDVEDAS